MTIHSDNTEEMAAPNFIHLEFAQMAHPPGGWTEKEIEQWLHEFSQMLDELRYSADRRLTDKQREYLVHILNFNLDEFSDDHIARGALDYVREFAAIHIADITGQTVCERACRQKHLLPTRVRSYISSLANSYWDLYEVERLESDGFLLRRLHDNTYQLLHAPEYNQPFVIGHVVALRLVNFGSINAAPLALQLDHVRVPELVHALETEFSNGRYQEKQWPEFMFHRGSFLILRHALIDLQSYDQVEPTQSAPSQTQDIELDLLVRLQSAFETLEAVINLDPDHYACKAVLVPTAAGQVIRIDDAGTSPELLIFKNHQAHELYEQYLQGEVSQKTIQNITFRRVWRLPRELASAEDLQRLERVDIHANPHGIVTPTRLLPGFVPADITDDDVEQLISACYLSAAYLKTTLHEAA